MEYSSGSPRVAVLEEWVHLRQVRYGQNQIGLVEVDLLENYPVGRLGLNNAQMRETAEEVHAKLFLLRHSKTFGLGKVDRWVLRHQVNRLRLYGVSKSY